MTENMFWSRVRKLRGRDACWLWLGEDGEPKEYGYWWERGAGWPSKKGKKVRAAKYAWEQEHGRKMKPGMCACHTCDNPMCVRPSHIFEGTLKQNNEDCTAKGRRAVGERSGQAKLTEVQVRAIHALAMKGIWAADVAKHFGLPYATVDNIEKGYTWAHLKLPKVPKRNRGAGLRCMVVDGEPLANCRYKTAVMVSYANGETRFLCSKHGLVVVQAKSAAVLKVEAVL